MVSEANSRLMNYYEYLDVPQERRPGRSDQTTFRAIHRQRTTKTEQSYDDAGIA